MDTATFLDSCKRPNSLSTYIPCTISSPSNPLIEVPLLVQKKLTTQNMESETFSSQPSQLKLRLKSVASGQLGTLIKSSTMLRSCVYITAICLELQPQYRMIREYLQHLRAALSLARHSCPSNKSSNHQRKDVPRHKESVLPKSMGRGLL